MNNKQFDEYQIATRNQIGFNSFILSMIITGISSILSYTDLNLLSNSIILQLIFYIPLTYYVCMSILKNAYLLKKERKFQLPLGFLVIIFSIFLLLKDIGNTSFFKEDILLTINNLSLLLIGLSSIINHFAIKKELSESQD